MKAENKKKALELCDSIIKRQQDLMYGTHPMRLQGALHEIFASVTQLRALIEKDDWQILPAWFPQAMDDMLVEKDSEKLEYDFCIGDKKPKGPDGK